MPQLLTIDFELEGFRPAVTRTLRLPDSYTVYELHLCVQIALGWNDHEDFEFVGTNLTVGTESKYAGDGLDYGGHRYRHADEWTIADLFGPIGERVSYTYDFARFWTGKLTLRARSWELDELPSCVEAEGIAPPELLEDRDSYGLLAAAYEDSSNGLHVLAQAVFGEEFDFEAPEAEQLTQYLEAIFLEGVEAHGEDESEEDEENWGWWDPSKYDERMRLQVLKEEIEERLPSELEGGSAGERQAALLAALRGRRAGI